MNVPSARREPAPDWVAFEVGHVHHRTRGVVEVLDLEVARHVQQFEREPVDVRPLLETVPRYCVALSHATPRDLREDRLARPTREYSVSGGLDVHPPLRD